MTVCCNPYYPAGLRAFHSKFCRVSPNKPMTDAEKSAWRERKRTTTPKVAPGVSKDAKSVSVSEWRKHHYACVCWTCSYVDSHLDDADDAVPEVVS